ncbi:MAG: N-methyl-L-tryptophan oxidase [Gemmatimonadetes bacterium]|nr:N-methyl-L-tryptophan oxidase [Gemmatimonadota bacterium]
MVIAGLGITGAAAAVELARRGRSVLAVDARVPPHSLGSSHGRTRIIREAYYEHPLYVPLVQRAYASWRALERRSGTALLLPTGGLHIGPPAGDMVAGVLRSVRDHALDHEILEPAAIHRRFPALSVQKDEIGILEPNAGVLRAEPCLKALIDAAAAAGATLRTGDAMMGWDAGSGGVTVALGSGRVSAAHLVLALGAWLPRFVDVALEIERQFVTWFEPIDPERVRPGRIPVLMREYAPGRIVYAFPDLGHGLKASIHHEGEPCDPETVDRTVRPAEIARVRSLLDAMLPGSSGGLLDSVVCLYTNTKDGHFAIGTTDRDRVVVASACSGHGFKFAPVTGELIASLVTGESAGFDLSPFRLERLC